MKQEIKDRVEKIKNGEVPEGYKNSYIGTIPEEWILKEISEIADVKGGKRIPKGYSLTENNTGFPYITVGDMKNGGIDINNIKYVPLEVVDKIKNYRVYEDDLFISVAGTLGIVGKIPKQLNGANLTENADKITNIKISKDYLYHVLTSSIIQKNINNEKTTNAQPKLALERIRKFLIPLSSEFESEKIASILSTWDKTIKLKEKLIEEKKKQKKGLMQKLLTGEVKLPGFDGEWKEDRLGDIAEMNSGGTPKSTYPEYYDGNIPWVSISDMTKNGKYIYTTERNISELGLNNSSAKLYPIDTVLFAMYASIGECSISKVELSSSQAILGIRPGSILNNEYLYYYLTSIKEKLKLQGQQGTQSNLNAGMIKELRLWLPEINEQLAIVNILTTSDKEISFLDQELEALKQQKKGLMQLLLTGIVRVNSEN